MLDEKFDGHEAEVHSEESSPARAPDEALVTGAECLASLGHYSEARLQLDAALRLNPDNGRARALSAAIHEAVVAPLVGEAASAFLSNELEKAEDLLLEVLAIDPEHGQASRILDSVRSRGSMGSGGALYSSTRPGNGTGTSLTKPGERKSRPDLTRAVARTARHTGLAPILTDEALSAETRRVRTGSKKLTQSDEENQPSTALVVSLATISLCLFIVFFAKSFSREKSIVQPSTTLNEETTTAARAGGPAGTPTSLDRPLPPLLSASTMIPSSDLAQTAGERFDGRTFIAIAEPIDIGPKEMLPAAEVEPTRTRRRPEIVANVEPAPIAPETATPSNLRAVEVASMARAALDGGDWEIALDLAGELTDLAPGSSLLARLSNDILSAAVTRAGAARLEALSVGATEESTRFFADAVGLVRIGDSTAERSAIMAARSYYVGADLFQRSAEAAQAAQIRATLDTYVEAHLKSSMQRLKDVWPSLGGEDLVETKRSFRSGKHLEMTVNGCSTKIGDTLAIATCNVSQTYNPRFGPKRKTATEVSFQLRREGSNWRIEARKPAAS